MLDVAALAGRPVDALVDGAVLAPVEERPDEVDSDGDDEDRVHGDAVCVEADSAVLPRDNTEETIRMLLSGGVFKHRSGTHPTMAIKANQV